MKIRQRPVIYFTLGATVAIIVTTCFSFKKVVPSETSVEVQSDGHLQYKWSSPETPRSLSFCGEKVPLERQDIREQMDRELTNNYYYQSSTLYILKLTTRYFPIIEERLKANGVPDDFKYLCVAESSLQNPTSKAGAVGYWQFVKETGTRYGLTINDEVDERYSIERSTDAACRYFKDAYAKFGSWTAAAASYNCGLAGFDKFSAFQQSKNYYDLLLPDETMRYVFRILTFKYILSDPSRTGYTVQSSEYYKPYKTKTVTVTSTIPDLAQYAINNGTNYRMLKTLNPWLRDHALTLTAGQSYNIQLPAN